MAERARAYILGLSLLAAWAWGDPTQPARTLTEPVSGFAYQSSETQALQQDEFANPGLLWVDRGRTLWRDGSEGPACASCHDAPSAMREVAPRYPRFDAAAGTVINLTQRINRCRVEHQQLPAHAYENDALLALTALVSHQARGLPFNVDIGGAARPHFDAGRAYFYKRRGQMNLAYHHCHEANAGRMLRGDRLSQGHGNGYPIYRLAWQTVGSLHRRLQFCNTGVRAESAPLGDQRYVNLELFLAWRAGALPIETPGVRR